MRVQAMRKIDYFVGIPLCFLVSIIQRVLNLFQGVQHILYRSTVFWTPSDLKLGGMSQGTPLLMSHLGRGFISMPSNQPGLIILTLELM